MQKTPVITELKRLYKILNDGLFGGNLKPVDFLLQAKRKTSLRWWQEQESIVIGLDFVNLEYNEIVETLLHEMIHISNFQNGVLDVTANQYHNKNFLQSALEVGLVVTKHKTQGWSITSATYPRNSVEKLCIERPSKENAKIRSDVFDSIELDKNAIKSGFAEIQEKIRDEKPIKTFFLKYECNCDPPHNSIRSGRRPDGNNAPNIQCLNCHSKFKCVSE